MAILINPTRQNAGRTTYDPDISPTTGRGSCVRQPQHRDAMLRLCILVGLRKCRVRDALWRMPCLDFDGETSMPAVGPDDCVNVAVLGHDIRRHIEGLALERAESTPLDGLPVPTIAGTDGEPEADR